MTLSATAATVLSRSFAAISSNKRQTIVMATKLYAASTTAGQQQQRQQQQQQQQERSASTSTPTAVRQVVLNTTGSTFCKSTTTGTTTKSSSAAGPRFRKHFSSLMDPLDGETFWESSSVAATRESLHYNPSHVQDYDSSSLHMTSQARTTWHCQEEAADAEPEEEEEEKEEEVFMGVSQQCSNDSGWIQECYELQQRLMMTNGSGSGSGDSNSK